MDKAYMASTPMIVLDIRKYQFRLKNDDEEVFGDGISYLTRKLDTFVAKRVFYRLPDTIEWLVFYYFNPRAEPDIKFRGRVFEENYHLVDYRRDFGKGKEVLPETLVDGWQNKVAFSGATPQLSGDEKLFTRLNQTQLQSFLDAFTKTFLRLVKRGCVKVAITHLYGLDNPRLHLVFAFPKRGRAHSDQRNRPWAVGRPYHRLRIIDYRKIDRYKMKYDGLITVGSDGQTESNRTEPNQPEYGTGLQPAVPDRFGFYKHFPVQTRFKPELGQNPVLNRFKPGPTQFQKYDRFGRARPSRSLGCLCNFYYVVV
ncbi:LOW QUALITY PROTEIN: hypothetical protein OSB04_018393 [Centaurea solstitialis]|uniref:Uncharacterized protein n=1 Tax=Centaurea solstitialis TaxID=347529 RepID=A0AA38TPN8_9ASTR|nr:LOW QUALITY PROTEIN: hypothetical protein OSB04_018393 [Centaurea solstitialis]